MRVEIGGGPSPAYPHYAQFDAIDWRERTGLAYTIGDARSLPYGDGTVDAVFSSNLLEHFPADETDAILTEWARVLAPGGTLELVVPCAMGILHDFFSGINTWEQCAERLLGSRDYPGNEHRTAFCLAGFPAVIAQIPTLELAWCQSSHAGGGVHSMSVKRRDDDPSQADADRA